MKRLLKSSMKTKFIFSLLLLIISVLLAVSFGSADIDFKTLVHSLCNLGSGDTEARILLHVRLPRVLAAALCGAALALSGALLQTALHNSLAAPNIIGVNSGAGVGVLMVLAFAPAFTSAAPLAAFLGALLACALVYFIASRAGAARLTLVLAGIATSSFLGAISDTVITLFPETQSGRMSFLIGGFSGVSMSQILAALPVILLGITGAILISFDLNTLALGDEIASSLGVRVKRTRAIALFCAALLSGGSVAISGLLGFVGLIVPHIARRIVGYDLRTLIPMCVILGASFTLLCDLIARVLFAPFELPVGIVLSLIGAPFFIYLLLMEKRHAKSF